MKYSFFFLLKIHKEDIVWYYDLLSFADIYNKKIYFKKSPKII